MNHKLCQVWYKEYWPFFWSQHTACWILVPLTRNWTWTMAVKTPIPNHWTIRKFPKTDFKNKICCECPKQVDSLGFKNFNAYVILKEMGIPEHLTCLLRNLYAGQEATVRIGHGTTDWFQIWKGVHQGCILSPCLFNLYAEYIMRNAGLEEAQAGIKIVGRNINNLRYADDTTLMAESEEN